MFPKLDDIDDLTLLLPVYQEQAAQCLYYGTDGSTGVRYPCLGEPYPHQPKVCKAVVEGQGLCCGVGGHTQKTHAKDMSLATRALTHAVWLLEHMEHMAKEEVGKQITGMLHMLCGLELRRQEQTQHGFPVATAEMKSILVMYTTVTDVWVTMVDHSSSLARKTRNFRSTTQVLNKMLPQFLTASPTIPPDVYAEVVGPKCFAVFLFPTTDHAPDALSRLCNAAFQEAGPEWHARMRRSQEGHRPECQGATCACDRSDPMFKVQETRQLYGACTACGLIGHNKGSCLQRSPATHIAMALATMIDPVKMSRFTPKAGHLCLCNCYHMLVALLYRWWSVGDVEWGVRGISRLVPVGDKEPALLLRFFNHIVAHLKQHTTFGQGMVVLLDNDHLNVEAAHLYKDPRKRKGLLPETIALKRKARDLTEAYQDDDLYRTVMTPQHRDRVRNMVRRSASVNPNLVTEVQGRETDIGLRFAFDDIFLV